MVKKTLGYVQLEWTCAQCGTRNPGSQKSCSSCGAAQPKRVDFAQPAQEKMVTDQAEIARAKAGPDVHCAFCGARNPSGASRCTQCGADLASAEARASGQVLGAHRDRPAEPIACPQCGKPNDPLDLKCAHCGASLPRAKPDLPAAPPPTRARQQAAAARQAKTSPFRSGSSSASQARKPLSKWIVLGAMAFVLTGLVLCALLVVLTQSRPAQEIVAVVQSVSWTRTIETEALQQVTRQDWKTDIPYDAQLGRCTSKLHHTQDEPAANATEVCGTPYTVDKGTGYGEVVQDCEYKVYAEWCEYQTTEWRKAGDVELSGNDLNPRWPTFDPGPGLREAKRQEDYRVVLEADGKTYTYRTQDVDRFRQCEVASRWTIQVNAFGAVTRIQPAP